MHDPLSDRVDFRPFPHFVNNAWQGSETLPDPALGWAMLNVEGGHPGDSEHQVIRRWTAPAAGTLHIEGELSHPAEQGNGVLARVVSASRGCAGEWTAAQATVPTVVEAITVAAGETVDLVVDSRGDFGYDSFVWRTKLQLHRDDGAVDTWNTHDGIDGPNAPRPVPLDRWSQLAQVLLMSNEFMFVD